MGVSGDAVTAGESQMADAILESIYQECGEIAPMPWPLDAIPHEALFAMADYLAAELAPSFGMAAPTRPGRAKLRVMALMNPDNRRPAVEAEYF